MKRFLIASGLFSMTALGTACSDAFGSNDQAPLSAALISSAFTTVPLGFSNVTSSFAGDADGLGSMFLPGPRMRGFGDVMMGGGIQDAYVGGVDAGRGFGHHGPFGGRFGGGFTCMGTFNASTGRFVCTPVTRNGLTLTQSMAYSTTAGAVQQAFDTATTNTVNVQSATAGTLTFARDSNASNRNHGPRHIGRFAGDTTTILTANTTVNHSSSRTVGGLASGSTRRTVEATSSGTESTTGTSSRGTFSATRAAADTTRGLIIPIAEGKPTYPTAGTVIRSMRASVTFAGAAAVSSTRREVITYDGTTTAKIVITKDGVTQNCTMTLPRGRPVCN